MPVLETQRHSVMQGLVTGIRFTLLMLVLCGACYSPLATLLAHSLFPRQAEGSLIVANGKALGSALIGQPFISNRYFQGRPSAAAHNPMAAAGSNLAPDNPELRLRVLQDSERIQAMEGVTVDQIPAELLAASGSGLDPHISPESAGLQIPRIASTRKIDEAELKALVNRHTEGKQFGLLGKPRVNVLVLNIELDQLQQPAERR